MRVKKLTWEKKAERNSRGGGEAQLEEDQMEEEFFLFHFNLYDCGFPSETNVHCLLIVHVYILGMDYYHLSVSTLAKQQTECVCVVGEMIAW